MPLTDAVVRQTGPAQSTVKLSDGDGSQLWIMSWSPKSGQSAKLVFG